MEKGVTTRSGECGHVHSQEQPEAGPSRKPNNELFPGTGMTSDPEEEKDFEEEIPERMNPEGYSGLSQKVVKPLTPEALAAYKAAQDRAGIIYISRIPPGMQPAKVRHLMSAYGEIGRVYLQQEDPKRAYLRKKYTSTKKPHFTEGWVEFKDKKIARSVAEMLNAQPIGGKKGTRWRDDVWTMKYLPKFKWHMLTEQVAHEAAIHTAKLRVELSQSRSEQQEYLRNVEIARQLEKRAEKKREKGEELQLKPINSKKRARGADQEVRGEKRRKAGPKPEEEDGGEQLITSVLRRIF
ncbi:hypothetical protein AMATHDRAFT_144750 [Amanita thiersii Skay4041]|uniref:18S rRNA factor 2 n=1 Tax=Amanita thiersii Skay4041 TaxID=703135 RepID=A0A2A9NSE8_9AGAR|nr:hypothetical protein AMATHDRAFT_144750 [Amanita thiersii Skay4041]